MSGENWTPGPWVALPDKSGPGIESAYVDWSVDTAHEVPQCNDPECCKAAPQCIAHVPGDGDTPSAKRRAHLIAAAPDLYAALRELLDVTETALARGEWEPDGACDPELDIRVAKNALARARGEMP